MREDVAEGITACSIFYAIYSQSSQHVLRFYAIESANYLRYILHRTRERIALLLPLSRSRVFQEIIIQIAVGYITFDSIRFDAFHGRFE